MAKRVLTDPCIEKAMDDEPGWVLLARDATAPMLIELWCQIRRLEIANGTRPVSDLESIAQSELEAERMRHWRRDANFEWRKQGELDLAPLQSGTVNDEVWKPKRHFDASGQS